MSKTNPKKERETTATTAEPTYNPLSRNSALCEKDWAVRVLFGGEEVYSSSAILPTFSESRAGGASIPLKRRCSLTTSLLHGSSCPAPPSVSADCSEPTQEGRSPACRVASRWGRPWWFMYDTMDLLCERTSTWCPRMSGRKNLLLLRLLLRPKTEGWFVFAQRSPTLVRSICYDNLSSVRRV